MKKYSFICRTYRLAHPEPNTRFGAFFATERDAKEALKTLVELWESDRRTLVTDKRVFKIDES
jgi:hypothetical protein